MKEKPAFDDLAPVDVHKFMTGKTRNEARKELLEIKHLEASLWRHKNEWWITPLQLLAGAIIGALITLAAGRLTDTASEPLPTVSKTGSKTEPSATSEHPREN